MELHRHDATVLFTPRHASTTAAGGHSRTLAQASASCRVDHPPDSVKAHRVKENIDIFDVELAADEVASIDALDTGVRGGLDPATFNMTTHPKTVQN